MKWVLLFLLITLLVFSSIILIGSCFRSVEYEGDVVRSRYYDTDVVTVERDGQKFIVFRGIGCIFVLRSEEK